MNRDLLLHNTQLVTPQGRQHGWLLARAGKIAAIGAGIPPAIPAGVPVIDAGGQTLLPGFIDVHVHGAVGHEAMDATPEALDAMARFYAQHGVTGYLATTWTAGHMHILQALAAVASVMQSQQQRPYAGAKLLGAHLEGPYLNPAKCGAQDSAHIRRAERGEALQLLDTGVVRLLALAPEYPENHWLIGECLRRGITVSAAHTGATYADICAAVELGLRQTTHTFNAMTALHHREPGVVGAALTLPQLTCELIADNVHVHPAVMRLLWLAKGAPAIILISDAVRGAGLPPGTRYMQDEREVTVHDSAYLADGTLAGSTLTMDAALRNFRDAVGQPLEHLWRTSSLNAAHMLGLADDKGSLQAGKDADLVLVDADLRVLLTVVEGQVVYRL